VENLSVRTVWRAGTGPAPMVRRSGQTWSGGSSTAGVGESRGCQRLAPVPYTAESRRIPPKRERLGTLGESCIHGVGQNVSAALQRGSTMVPSWWLLAIRIMAVGEIRFGSSFCNGPHPNLSQIRRTNAVGVEFWSSRDFAQVLGYADFGNFEQVIQKARTGCGCFNSANRIERRARTFCPQGASGRPGAAVRWRRRTGLRTGAGLQAPSAGWRSDAPYLVFPLLLRGEFVDEHEVKMQAKCRSDAGRLRES